MIAYYLPNRAFYSELNHLDETQLWSMIGHVMAYALLEVFSLLLFVLVIHRTTHPFPLQHLSFVLEHDRPKVQPKIAIWVVLVLQAMLPQNGKI
ncbi:hypothetical protein BBJ28_00000665 [Nothophytophthora sp. Chile5]|nr:hypothetical protein BBJ28_00000665 [Nothophytophthora sp. Chile5]